MSVILFEVIVSVVLIRKSHDERVLLIPFIFVKKPNSEWIYSWGLSLKWMDLAMYDDAVHLHLVLSQILPDWYSSCRPPNLWYTASQPLSPCPCVCTSASEQETLQRASRVRQTLRVHNTWTRRYVLLSCSVVVLGKVQDFRWVQSRVLWTPESCRHWDGSWVRRVLISQKSLWCLSMRRSWNRESAADRE